MRQAGVAGVSRRNFTAEAPDRLWVADITYIPTWAGFLYLAVVLDACSRLVIGWSMATTLATQLVLDALDMALLTRLPSSVIHHSDQGSQAELKWSSQHLEGGSCDDEAQATFGSVWSGAIVLTRAVSG